MVSLFVLESGVSWKPDVYNSVGVTAEAGEAVAAIDAS